MPQNLKEIRKQVSLAFAERAIALHMPKQRKDKEVRGWFQSAAKAFELAGNAEAAKDMQNAYSLIVETGFGQVFKWAGIDQAVAEASEQQEAA